LPPIPKKRKTEREKRGNFATDAPREKSRFQIRGKPSGFRLLGKADD